jgi:cysteine synthase A
MNSKASLEKESTPLVRLTTIDSLTIYAKLENRNPSGSIKYRTISRILEDATITGELKHNMNLIEISSGNTGIALALRGGELNHPVTIITLKDATEESKKMIRGYGAELIEVNGWYSDGEKIIKDIMNKEPGKWFWTKQVTNKSSLASNFNLGLEINKQFSVLFGGSIDIYLASVSTGSTLSGVGAALKKVNPKTIIYRVLPDIAYKYPGVDDEDVSTVPLSLYNKNLVDKRIRIKEIDAINAAKELYNIYSHDVGISAGADFAAAKSIAKTEKGNAVIIFPDSGNRYISVLRA